MQMVSLIRQSLETGQSILANRSGGFRKAHGQFLTPEPLARFMAEQLGTIKNGDHILDPAMGSGTLICAIIERLIIENKPIEVWIDGFELDEELFTAAVRLYLVYLCGNKKLRQGSPPYKLMTMPLFYSQVINGKTT